MPGEQIKPIVLVLKCQMLVDSNGARSTDCQVVSLTRATHCAIMPHCYQIINMAIGYWYIFKIQIFYLRRLTLMLR